MQAPLLHAEVEAHAIDPGHAAGEPAVHVWLLLHVLLVNIDVLVLHEAVPQSEPAAG